VIVVTGLPKDDVGEVAATLARAQDQNIGYAG
jgi:ribosomal protein L6P/L9E